MSFGLTPSASPTSHREAVEGARPLRVFGLARLSRASWLGPSGMPVENHAHVPRQASGSSHFENTFRLGVANTCVLTRNVTGVPSPSSAVSNDLSGTCGLKF